MDKLIEYISHTSAQLQIMAFSAMFFISWIFENINGLWNKVKWKHAFLNVRFGVPNIILQFPIGILFILTMKWTCAHHFGLLYLITFTDNKLVLFFIAFLFLDFGEYVYHILMHRIKNLWSFHLVHHMDPIVDVSTTFREHPGENLIRNAFTLLWVFLSGTFLWMLIIRQIIQAMSNVFAHSNCCLPEKLDRFVGWVVITPNLHHVHHHFKQPFTDCNYGDVLVIWDRLFKTFVRLPRKDLVYGLDSVEAKDNMETYSSLIKMPFANNKQH